MNEKESHEAQELFEFRLTFNMPGKENMSQCLFISMPTMEAALKQAEMIAKSYQLSVIRIERQYDEHDLD